MRKFGKFQKNKNHHGKIRLNAEGQQQKLHTKLIKQKKDKKVEAKNSRLVRLKALRALANKQEEEK